MNQLQPYERKVFYYETDKMGIVHHSNYIRIFEEARVSFINQIGIPFEDIESMGLMMPVLSVTCNYKHPLVFDEPFAVHTKVVKFNGVSIEMEYRITSRKSGELCADGRSSHCFTDLNLKPVRIRHSHPEVYRIMSDHMNCEMSE